MAKAQKNAPVVVTKKTRGRPAKAQLPDVSASEKVTVKPVEMRKFDAPSAAPEKKLGTVTEATLSAILRDKDPAAAQLFSKTLQEIEALAEEKREFDTRIKERKQFIKDNIGIERGITNAILQLRKKDHDLGAEYIKKLSAAATLAGFIQFDEKGQSHFLAALEEEIAYSNELARAAQEIPIPAAVAEKKQSTASAPRNLSHEEDESEEESIVTLEDLEDVQHDGIRH